MFVSPFAAPFPNNPFATQKKEVAAPVVSPAPTAPQYVNFLADRLGCGMWRIGWPEHHINNSGLGESTSLQKMVLDKGFYYGVKAVKIQRQASDHQKQFVQFLKSIQPEMGFKLMYEIDDVPFREDIPDYNIGKPGFDNDGVRQNIIDIINMCDEVTVTCKHMRDLFRERTGKQEISVVPNFPPYWWIGHQYNYNKIVNNFEKNKKKPRIVYAGAGAHFDINNVTGQRDDFSHVLKFIIDNKSKYQFVFIGAFPPPLLQYIQNGEIEFHPWKSLMEYPNFLSSLNAQLFLAPLEDNTFNRSKSDIKYIEAACLGVPCLVQDMVTYENAMPDLKFKDADELAEKVERILNYKNRSKYFKLIPELRKVGEDRFLEHPSNIGAFLEAINTPYGDPSRFFMKKWN